VGNTLAEADAVKGSYISKVVSWGHGHVQSVSRYAGRAVRIRVAMADAQLFAVEFKCFRRGRTPLH
jgi:hypothetical protein